MFQFPWASWLLCQMSTPGGTPKEVVFCNFIMEDIFYAVHYCLTEDPNHAVYVSYARAGSNQISGSQKMVQELFTKALLDPFRIKDSGHLRVEFSGLHFQQAFQVILITTTK